MKIDRTLFRWLWYYAIALLAAAIGGVLVTNWR